MNKYVFLGKVEEGSILDDLYLLVHFSFPSFFFLAWKNITDLHARLPMQSPMLGSLAAWFPTRTGLWIHLSFGDWMASAFAIG